MAFFYSDSVAFTVPTVSLFGTYHSPTTAVSFFTFGNAYIGFGVHWRNFLKKKKRTN